MNNLDQLIRQAPLKPLQKLVLFVLAPHAQTGAVVSQVVLRDETGLSRAALNDYIESLRELGIVTTNQVGPGAPLSYAIHAEKLRGAA